MFLGLLRVAIDVYLTHHAHEHDTMRESFWLAVPSVVTLNQGKVAHNILEDPFRRRTRKFVKVALVVLAVEIGYILDPRYKQKLFPLLCRRLRRFCHLAFSHSEHAVAEDVDLALVAFHFGRIDRVLCHVGPVEPCQHCILLVMKGILFRNRLQRFSCHQQQICGGDRFSLIS